MTKILLYQNDITLCFYNSIVFKRLMNCTIQTKEDHKASISILHEALNFLDPSDQTLEKCQHDLIQASSLLSPEENKIAENSMAWFVTYDNKPYMIQRTDQQIPKESKVLRSSDSDQMLFISSICGGLI